MTTIGQICGRTLGLRRRRVGATAAGLVALAIALLGSGPAGGADAGAAATASATKTVRIPGFAFKPANLTISRGDRVTFANRSTVTHTATRRGAFDTKAIRPGRSVTVRFKQRGSFAYHCKIHPFMHGRIVVR